MSRGSGLSRRLASFGNAARGLRAVAAEPNARIQLLAAGIVLALAGWLELGRRDFALLLLAIGLVLGFEAMNTALEALADRVAPDRHPLVAKAKDVAAGAALIAALAAALLGFCVLGPPLLARLGG
jgi:diacylglycerol kinase (ATP)